jgi:flagellar protein FliO/FliZ
MSGKSRLFFSAILLTAPAWATAVEGTRPAYTPPPSAVSSGNIVQIIFSLLMVLAAILLVAWLLKRMNAAQLGSGNMLRILSSVAIGQRERIVLVEVKDTWLLVGVGPGQIRTLHTLQKQEFQNSEKPTPTPRASENKFAKLLSSFIHPSSSDRNRNAP